MEREETPEQTQLKEKNYKYLGFPVGKNEENISNALTGLLGGLVTWSGPHASVSAWPHTVNT